MSTWAVNRMRFNHDRLKNQFIQSVNRLIRTLQGRVIDDAFVEDFCGRLTSTWAGLEAEALELLDRAEGEAGPAEWFTQYPLRRLSAEDRRWMEEVAGAEWQEGSGIQRAVGEARAAVADVAIQCRKLQETFISSAGRNQSGSHPDEHPDEGCHARHDREMLERAMNLHGVCQSLSAALSRLSFDDPICVIAALNLVKRHE